MKNIFHIRWTLVVYDTVIFWFITAGCILMNTFSDVAHMPIFVFEAFLAYLCVFAGRILFGVYRQIWRYGGIQCYLRLLSADVLSVLVYTLFAWVLHPENMPYMYTLLAACLNLLGALAIRMIYRYAYKFNNDETAKGRFLKGLLKVFAGYTPVKDSDSQKIKVAIIGAGDVGVGLAKELRTNSAAAYTPRCFIDISRKKIGREIQGIPVLPENEATLERLKSHGIQEIIFAIHSSDARRKKELYEYYKRSGCKLKVYDYPTVEVANGKRQLREFDIEELLFRKPIQVTDPQTTAYYRNKVVLVTGGGGSIGSEICRQIAKMQPARLVILDICENGAYDIQQELRIAYGAGLPVSVEIVSITNHKAMETVFSAYHPQIVIHAAAHKHVPLMEHNCIEAIENNVIGTQNLISLCEAYNADRFMMVSTDKAVNPTNVMGATKRMCEMLVQSASCQGKVQYSATRFGNVLGSAGSVIPLFKKQIAAGGPITITDKRIIRYFMTISEATQLVLQSGAMAKNGELFVLDMGEPVKILDLAKNMIQLSGAADVQIVETGLRPGEKLYEELLVEKETLRKTENELIFIETDVPPDVQSIREKLALLKTACASGDEQWAKEALRKAVPTFKTPDEINASVGMGKRGAACCTADVGLT